jgi:hypothetical protein
MCHGQDLSSNWTRLDGLENTGMARHGILRSARDDQSREEGGYQAPRGSSMTRGVSPQRATEQTFRMLMRADVGPAHTVDGLVRTYER